MLRLSLSVLVISLLAACSSAPQKSARSSSGMAITAPRAYAPPRGFPNFVDHSVGREEISIQAMSLVGVPYRWGGNTPDSGFDCSGLVRYVVDRAASVNLPRTTADMSSVGESIEPDGIAPGDLIFFNTSGRPHSHVGIYVGKLRFVNAPSTGGTVRLDYLTNPYWAKRFDGIRRVAAPKAKPTPFDAPTYQASRQPEPAPRVSPSGATAAYAAANAPTAPATPGYAANPATPPIPPQPWRRSQRRPPPHHIYRTCRAPPRRRLSQLLPPLPIRTNRRRPRCPRRSGKRRRPERVRPRSRPAIWAARRARLRCPSAARRASPVRRRPIRSTLPRTHSSHLRPRHALPPARRSSPRPATCRSCARRRQAARRMPPRQARTTTRSPASQTAATDELPPGPSLHPARVRQRTRHRAPRHSADASPQQRAAARAAARQRQNATSTNPGPRETLENAPKSRTGKDNAPQPVGMRRIVFFRTARRGVASRDRRAQRIRTRGARSTTRPPRSMPMRESSAPMPTRCCLRRPTVRPTACASRRRRRSHP